MTTVYLTRHSLCLKDFIGTYNTLDSLQLQNEKTPLSIEGEERASKLSELEVLNNIDVLYSSNYTRTIQTAKYIASKNNLKINIDERLGERKFGVEDYSDLPQDYEIKQFEDFDYSTKLGETLNEVKKRMSDALFEIINNNKDKNICIVSHSTAMSALFSTWCDIKQEDVRNIYYNGKLLIGSWDAPQLFKLEFDGLDLVNIELVK